MNAGNRFGRLLRGISLGAMSAGLAIAAPAYAQDPPAAPAAPAASDDETEITVTAQFREQRLQDTPLSITAVTGETLEARGQTDLADIGAYAPNVTLREAPATYGPAVAAYIRGVGQRDTTFALEPGVGLYIDDVYYPTMQGTLIELIDLERVEILRGPQGTLAGQNSIGGAIRLYSRRPDASGSGYIQATYGSYNRMELRAAHNFTIANGLYARLSGTAARRDGFITRYDYRCTHPTVNVPSSVTERGCKLGTEGGREYIAGRLAVRWEPTDRISLDLVADITEDNSEPGPTTLLYVGQAAVPGSTNTGSTATAPYLLNGVPYGGPTGSIFVSSSPYGPFALDPFSSSPYISYENYTDLAPRDGSAPWQAPLTGSVDSWGVSANLQIDLSEHLKLVSITGYRRFDGNYSSGDGSPYSATLQANRVFNRQFSQEVRLTGQIGTIVNFTIGGFYFDKTSRNVSRITLPTLNFIEENSIPAETIAAFANVEVTPTEGLSLIFGARYTDQEKSFHYGRFGVPGSSTGGAPPPAVAGLNGLVGTFEGHRVDYRAVLQYRWNEQLMTYAQFSTGFKGGGINARPFFITQALPHNPETLEAYEIGFKSDWFDRAVRLNVSGFMNNYSDILVTASSCPLPGSPAAPCALPLNAGEARVQGLEAELTVRPARGFTIDASLAYLHFEYKSILPQAATSGIGLEDDGQYIQPWQWSLGAQYQFDVGFGSMTARVDVNFEDDFNRNANNVNAANGGVDIFGHVEDRTLVNARLAWRDRDEHWTVALEVRNLTDQLYYTDVFDNRGSTQSIQGRPGEPRTWSVTVRREF
jgi:iron complex outermembrane receptor protein